MQENMVISSWMQTVLDQAQDLDVLCLMYSDVQEDIQALICWAQQGTCRYVALVVDRFFANQDLLTQLTFRFYECTDNPADVFTRVAWDSVFLRVAFVEKAKTALSEVFDECHLGVHLVASEVQDMAKKYVSNVRKNILIQDSCIDLLSLKDGLKSVPAIICGAGESLDVSGVMSLSSKAIIFAGGSSLAALSQYGAHVHLAAGTDPSPCYERFLQSADFRVPFFYQDRFSNKILSKMHGEKIRVPANPGYFFEEWLSLFSLGHIKAFDGGWTVTTFMAAIAAYLGCSPIIFHGVDLSFSSKMYTDLLKENSEDADQWIPLPGSNQYKTKKDWIMASKWLKDFIAHHEDIEFLSTSNLDDFCLNKSTLASIDARLHPQDISGRIHSMLQRSQKNEACREKQALAIFSKSLLSAQNIIDKMLSMFESFFPNDPTQNATFVLLQYELQELACYGALIMPIWSVWKKVFDRMEYPSPHLQTLNELLFIQKIVSAHVDQGDVYA